MVRASKLPFRNFEYNLRRSRALANLDVYLDDLLNNQGNRTIGPILDLRNQVMKETGMDEVMKRFEKQIEAEAKEQFRGKSKEELDEYGKNIVRRIRPQIRKVKEIFEDLNLVMSSTLREQALVLAVSAFEGYVREITSSIVSLNPSVRRRFHKEIEEGLSRRKLEDYREDALRAQGEIVAENVKLEPNAMRSIFRKLVERDDLFSDAETERRYVRILESRHLVIHRAGLVDPKFRRITKHKGPIDQPLEISGRYVSQSINLLGGLANRAELLIHQKKS
jgi:hypothetical protein